MALTRTPQQTNFISAVIASTKAGGGENHCLRARAGTGKSSTMVELVDDYTKQFPQHTITLCAFNRSAAVDLGSKLKEHGHLDWKVVNASTIHALGYSLLKYPYKSVVDNNKVRNLVKEQNGEIYREQAHNIARLVSFAKLEGFGFFNDVQINDSHAWYRIADHYDINGFDDTTTLDSVVLAAQHIYRLSLAQTDVIDYNDQILLPLVKNIRVRWPKDLLIVDEAQDTGRARQALIRKFVREKSGTLIVVGDDRQGIYGFAGAQSDALEQWAKIKNTTVWPLTVCWRCPRTVLREAQRLVPDIEWAPDAIEGEVVRKGTLPEQHRPTDAILCRNTAPLIETAYALLRKGVACKVEGREIGEGLLRIINRWSKVSTIAAFLNKLEDDRSREVQKAIAKGNEAKEQEVNDRCETLVHLCNVCLDRKQTGLDDLRAFVDSIFADDVTKSGIVTLCTYHRAKGREWSRVYLLQHSSRCPSKWAKQQWQKEQESNLAYVAITRAREILTYVE
jgi:DNA helicase II / ATP-dependent DNA helicase PcrA